MLAFVTLLAQFVIAPDSSSMEIVKNIFAAPPGRNTLKCQVESLSPRLGFSLLHWSGFNLNVPVGQFPEAAPSVQLGIAVQVTPKGGSPIFLGERLTVQQPPEGSAYPKGAAFSYSGGYYVGPGEYQVRFYAGDNRQLSCRKEWNIKVKAGKSIPRLEPGQVSAVGDERWRGLSREGPARRLTIVIEAAPLSPRRNMVRLSSYDRSVLLTSLTTLLDQSSATAATVIAVDPRNRRVIFSTDNFNQRQLYRLGRAIAGVNFGVVSLETLRGPSATDFMEKVLTSLQKPAAQSENVVFLGPAWGWDGKLTPKIRELAAALPRPYFLGISRFPGAPDNLVAQVVRSARGTVKQLVTPADFARVLEKIAPAR